MRKKKYHVKLDLTVLFLKIRFFWGIRSCFCTTDLRNFEGYQVEIRKFKNSNFHCWTAWPLDMKAVLFSKS